MAATYTKKVGSAKSPWNCGRAATHKKKLGSVKSSVVVDVNFERGMDCYYPFRVPHR